MQFENLEVRTALTAESFELIGQEAYFDNAAFSQYDGSGPSSTKYRIAILDSGAELLHSDFGQDVNPQNSIGDRIVYQQNFFDPMSNAADDHGHGTHVASIVARMAPGVELIILKITDSFNNADLSAVSDALDWVYQNRNTYNIVAVNMSFGDGGNYQTEQSGNDNTWSTEISGTLANLDAAGVICVAASGNGFHFFNSAEGIAYPAADPSVIAVGAVWDDDVGSQGGAFDGWLDVTTDADWVTAFTQRDEDLLDVLAPGGQITAAWESIGTSTERGTSQAAPHLTAAVALAQDVKQSLQGGGRLSKNDLVQLFQTTGVEIEDFDRPIEFDGSNVDETEHMWQRLNVQAMAFKLFKPTATDLKNTSDWGFSETDNKTFDTTPTITGTAPAGSHVWIYDGSMSIDDFQLGTGVSTFERTLPTLSTGTHNITVRVALDGSVAETNRSAASSVLMLDISATDSTTLTTAEQPFSARLSEFTGGQALIVSGENVSGTSVLTINWDTPPDPIRAIKKEGPGTLLVDDITDRSLSVTFLADVGTTVFTTDTGVSGVPGVSSRVANWIVEANANVEFTNTQNLAALSVGAAGAVIVAEADDAPDYNVLYTGSLAFAETAGHATGTLDLTNNGLVIDYATETAARNQLGQVRGWLIDGRGGAGIGNGTWDGTGIISSTAHSRNVTNGESRALGYAMNADLPLGAYSVFLGESVDSSTIIVRYTVTGDFNLDGSVNDDDITIYGAAYGEPGNGHWFLGDADYDGVVHDDDVTIVGGLYDPSYDIDEDPDPNP